MILGKDTPANLIKIKAPIWNGGKRCVGVASFRIGTHNQIEILYKNKDGERIYPLPFYASAKQLHAGEKMRLKNNPNIILHIVPLDELELLERASEKIKEIENS